ncbi:lysozyme [Parafrankia sp. BMG5.11]|uniref:lysozyme n=1 Tax=Parafrankia sp. BMG5.11 TaxID=222540 RepID=UPI001038EE2E|nr:lysozyme [Parafrankia sp. BMG5.11]TCJ38194.1 lysozyme [Parafrankia sp. BMG5.11]
MQRKIIFDTVRRLLGRGFSRREVIALDAAISAAQGDDPFPGDGDIGGEPLTIGARGVELIRQFEGCAKVRPDGLVQAYPDPGTGGAPWTIGWGATGPDIKPDTVWTRAECDARLDADIARHAADVWAAIGQAPTSQAQFDALVSFHFNTGAIARATLTKRHNAGERAAAAAEFARWNRAGGRVLPGLVRRRAAEAALYLAAE